RKDNKTPVIATPPRGGTATGGGSFPACGGVATVTAIPNDCYEFVNWTEDDVVLSNDPVYIFTVTKSSTLVANFEFGRQGYEITVLANPPEGGTVTGGGSFPACGGVATVTAIPNDCYEFVNWTEDDVPVSMDTYYTFTVTKNRTLVANFAPKRDGCEVIVLANPPQGGTVTGGGAYDCGDDVTICAIPVPCYEFLYWSEDGVALSTEACFTFTVTGNRTLVANFVLTEYEIIVLANPEDGGDVTGDGAYDCGEEVTVTATPAEGYIFVHWREADMIVSIDAVYSFVVTASRTLIAEFSGTTAIGEVETSGITIYPNPTSGELKVESGEWRVESVEVFDVYGRNVSRLTSHIAHPISIDISFLPSGIYFVRITTENNVVTKKIVKH
ncbi:MAG: T9SS type A sorting domain-containing protein, partial [Bacteroidales bacterium]|nr:T9SS type A sorting domain-containing protein [Bacteroidales bacterium]